MYWEEYKVDYDYTTKRLIVKEWHSYEPKELHETDLVSIVEEILVPEVTKTFPPMLQGKYDRERTKAWMKDRDSESKTLLAVEKETKKPIGLVNFFSVGDKSGGIDLRLGYLVSKVMWNNGLATELVDGFVHRCKENDISTVLAGVDSDNIASIRVLEKNNFLTETTDANSRRLLFEYELQ